MKIGVISHCLHPLSEPFQGGLEMITYLLVDELVKRGHDVSTLCKRGSEVVGNHVYYEDIVYNSNNPNLISDIENYGLFYKNVSEFIEHDFDLIHNHCLSHHAIIAGQLVTIPFVTTFHTPMFKNIEVAKNCCKNSSRQIFTTVSRYLNGVYQKSFQPVFTVYNGIDLSLWKHDYQKKDYYSWCGRICIEKGLAEIMDLCYSQGMNLKFAGPISDQDYFADEIQPRLHRYKNSQYLGHLVQTEINDLIGRSRAFLFSSIWEEPYGLVIAEALASGTPVIANNIGAASEIIDKSSGLLFNLSKPDSFVRAIQNLKRLKPTNCRLRAEQFCCHHKMVDAYEQLYQEIRHEKLLIL